MAYITPRSLEESGRGTMTPITGRPAYDGPGTFYRAAAEFLQ